VLRRLNRPAEALEAFQTAIKLDPKDSRAQFNLGNTYYELGRHQDANRGLSRRDQNRSRVPLDLSQPRRGALRSGRATTRRSPHTKWRWRRPRKPFAAGQPVDPAHARSYLNLGAIQMRKQNWPKALDAFQKSAKLDPSNAQASLSAGMVHYQLGQLDEAYQAYLRAIERDPTLPLASLHLGLIELSRNQPAAAVKWIEPALPRLDADAKHRRLLALAQAHAARNERDAAITRYQQALADRPNDAVALVGLGRLLRAAGQLADARTMLDRGRQAGGDAMAITLELAVIARTEGNVGAEKTLVSRTARRPRGAARTVARARKPRRSPPARGCTRRRRHARFRI
jgi:type IV pilus assembly protein PilF